MSTLHLCFALLVLFAASATNLQAVTPLQGLVVETGAGPLKPGDRLNGWQCSDHGLFRSPFEVSRDFSERHHCGAVIRVDGLRGTVRRSWSINQIDWESLVVRPRFDKADLSKYQIAEASPIEGAITKLESMVVDSPDNWLKIWLHLRGAELAAKSAAWEKTESEFDLALAEALRENAAIVAEVYLQKADVDSERQRWQAAAQNYREALRRSSENGAGHFVLAYILERMFEKRQEQVRRLSIRRMVARSIMVSEVCTLYS